MRNRNNKIREVFIQLSRIWINYVDRKLRTLVDKSNRKKNKRDQFCTKHLVSNEFNINSYLSTQTYLI